MQREVRPATDNVRRSRSMQHATDDAARATCDVYQTCTALHSCHVTRSLQRNSNNLRRRGQLRRSGRVGEHQRASLLRLEVRVCANRVLPPSHHEPDRRTRQATYNGRSRRVAYGMRPGGQPIGRACGCLAVGPECPCVSTRVQQPTTVAVEWPCARAWAFLQAKLCVRVCRVCAGHGEGISSDS